MLACGLALAAAPVPAAALAGGAVPALSIGDVTVTEGSGGVKTAQLQVKLSKESGRIVTVDYATADDTAKAGDDYTAMSGTLTFNKRQTSATIGLAIASDSVTETTETFTVVLTNAAGGATIADGTGVATIVDDDEPPADLLLSLEHPALAPFTDTPQEVKFRVGNTGTAPARDVSVLLRFDGAPLFDSVPSRCAVTGTDIRCELGDIENGAGGNLRTLAVSYLAPGSYAVSATADSASREQRPADNTKTVVLSVRNRVADVAIGASYSPKRDGHADYFNDVLQGVFSTGTTIEIINGGPDPIYEYHYNLDTGEMLAQVVGFDGPPGTDCSAGSCRFAEGLAAGETARVGWGVYVNPTASPQFPSFSATDGRLVDPTNPDGTFVDPNPSNNALAQVGYYAAPADFDLESVLYSAGGPAVSLAQQGTCSECRTFQMGVNNRGMWRAHSVVGQLTVPSNVRLTSFDSARCTLSGTQLGGAGGTLRCGFGTGASDGWTSVVRGADGDTCGSLGSFCVSFDVEYLAPGDVRFVLDVGGGSEVVGAVDVDATNNRSSVTRTVTLP